MTPREKEPPVGNYARRVATMIADLAERSGVSGRELARRMGRSNNYLAIRLRHEAAFTLTDVEAIGEALGFDPGTLLAIASKPSNVTPIKQNKVAFNPEEEANAAYSMAEEPEIHEP